MTVAGPDSMQCPSRWVLSLLLLSTVAVTITPIRSEAVDITALEGLNRSHSSYRSHGKHKHNTSVVVTSESAAADDTTTAAPIAAATATDGTANTAAAGNTTATIAQVLDKALIKEFEQDTKDAESGKGKTYNETVANEEGTVETVVRISGSSSSSDSSSDTSHSSTASSSSSASGQASSTDVSSSDSSGGGNTATAQLPEIELGVDRIIDSQDNEFVLSAPRDNVATLTLDPQLIQDLTFLFASAAVMGVVFESIKQPVINGYLVAGAIVGPGGLQLIKELVQVESLAQLGVQLLLFHLGRELSFKKLKTVWSVALLGGSLQIVTLMGLGGLVAAAVKSNVMQGVFLGALLSMSSTSVVVKCLEAYRMTASAYGQITIGTLILQDCSVGLMFALMPAFGAAAAASKGGSASSSTDTTDAAAVDLGVSVAQANSIRDAALLGAAVLLTKVMVKLVLVLAGAVAAARTILPVLLRILLRYASKELVQLSLVSLCLSSAWLCGRLGLSEELGAFIAGAMMSVAERKLVAAGLLLSSHGASQPASPRTTTSLLAAHYDHDSNQTSPRAPAGPAAYQAVPTDVLKSQASGAYSVESLPLHVLQPPGHSNKDDSFAGTTVSDSGSCEPAISVCANIESIQNVLTALFVASMGLIMSPIFLWHHAIVLLVGTLVVTLVKAAVVTIVIRMFGVPLKLGLAVALSMAHIGEFSLVLLSMANQLKLLSTQMYMLLLGVTAMSLLTTPFVILAAVHLLIKEGHHQLYISGPRLRLSSTAGDKPMQSDGGADWAIVMNDSQGLHGAGKAPVARTHRDGARLSVQTGARPSSASHREREPSPFGDASGSTHKRQQRSG